ncbi:MAG: hypothetical protein MT490_08760 [Sphingomonas sp.]|nr:hypothetical protein [Sphingomonas sp.]MCX8475871.1 hypothetical protein [Sphingomonas sp.]
MSEREWTRPKVTAGQTAFVDGDPLAEFILDLSEGPLSRSEDIVRND